VLARQTERKNPKKQIENDREEKTGEGKLVRDSEGKCAREKKRVIERERERE